MITPTLHARIMREVINPAINGIEQEGESYTGFLYAGLMITPDGCIKVLEFNCRMGDPETEVIMMRLKSSLVSLLEHALNGTLDKVEAEWDRRTALAAVMAAHGYPESPRKGDVIHGLAELPSCRQRKRTITYFTRARPWAGRTATKSSRQAGGCCV